MPEPVHVLFSHFSMPNTALVDLHERHMHYHMIHMMKILVKVICIIVYAHNLLFSWKSDSIYIYIYIKYKMKIIFCYLYLKDFINVYL